MAQSHAASAERDVLHAVILLHFWHVLVLIAGQLVHRVVVQRGDLVANLGIVASNLAASAGNSLQHRRHTFQPTLSKLKGASCCCPF